QPEAHVLSRRRQLADPRDRPLRHRRQAVALLGSPERELLRSAGVLVDAGMPLRPEILALSGAGSGQPGTGIRLLVPGHPGHVLAAGVAPARRGVNSAKGLSNVSRFRAADAFQGIRK